MLEIDHVPDVPWSGLIGAQQLGQTVEGQVTGCCFTDEMPGQLVFWCGSLVAMSGLRVLNS